MHQESSSCVCNKATNQGESLIINIISDIMVDPFFSQFLSSVFGEASYQVQCNYIRIQEYMMEENYEMIQKSQLNVVWINYDNFTFEKKNSYRIPEEEKKAAKQYLLEFIKMVDTNLKQLSTAQTIWLGFEDYFNQVKCVTGHLIEEEDFITNLNRDMKRTLGKENPVIDLKHLIAEVGIQNAYDPIGKYRWESPYSQVLMELVAKEVLTQYQIAQGKTKKCIVLDCDNVLWKGVISEDGRSNIKIGGTEGKWYKEFQKYMKALYQLGVILAVCSKNDLQDVLNVFEHNPDMVLTKEEISAFEVNWNPKVDNLKRISERLNISLNHMVFIDDSKFEIEAVKQMLPEVDTILFQKDVVYEKLNMFRLSVNIDEQEVKLRKQTYQMNEVREQMKLACANYRDYLNALEMKVTFETPKNLFRVSELSQRVNKASNGRRYRMGQLEALLDSGKYYLYSVRLEDKFGDLGIVGALGVRQQEDGNVLDLFCLSCRALGRDLEEKLIAFVKEKYATKQVYFQTTYKNDSLKELLEQHFTLISEG